LSLLYGISDELHQGLTPGRTPDVMDLVADTLGAALGVAFVLLIATFVVSRSSRPAR
jgi:VanZ family protein